MNRIDKYAYAIRPLYESNRTLLIGLATFSTVVAILFGIRGLILAVPLFMTSINEALDILMQQSIVAFAIFFLGNAISVIGLIVADIGASLLEFNSRNTNTED